MSLLKNPLFRIYIFSILIASAAVGLAVYFFKPAKIKLQFPTNIELLTSRQISCKSLVYSNLYGADDSINKGIFAKVSKGEDTVAIEIEDDKLYFLTGAAQEIGFAKGDAWEIIRNSKDRLIAGFSELDDPLRDKVHFFILNKTNGIGVWTTTYSDYVMTNNPAAYSAYLICR